MKPQTLAVIDLGSNSIKALVASRQDDGAVYPVFSATKETRIGSGMGVSPVYLQPTIIQQATQSIGELLEKIKPFEPSQTLIAATSAVREAVNQQDLVDAIFAQTGHALKILSGEEEALGIARGVLTDPLVQSLERFTAFDLGGGSLECIRIEKGQVMEAKSLPLGAVRLTEKWIADPKAPIPTSSLEHIRADVEATLKASGFNYQHHIMVGTSGAFTISRGILAYRLGTAFTDLSPFLQVSYIKALLREITQMSAEQRQTIPRLPPSRVDIFPAALCVVVTLADLLGVETITHSQRNLRFGLVMQMLNQ